jgi:pyruvate-ferredoxin/flavodoxin oxidoreductase
MTPDRPTIHGTAQNPDVYFQGRESVNHFYATCPGIVQATMDRSPRPPGGSISCSNTTVIPRRSASWSHGQRHRDHLGDRRLAGRRGEKVGVIAVRLFQPFHVKSVPRRAAQEVKAIAVLDRTKEPGSIGEPLFLNVLRPPSRRAARRSPVPPRIVGGRYGLGSKEFTPGMVRAVFDNLSKWEPRNHFTVGILDDVTGTSLPYDADFDLEASDVRRCVFVGLGADGTVGANKNSIKIIGEQTSTTRRATSSTTRRSRVR